MNTKMILTDLDHTLLRSDGSVSEYTKRILKKCQDCGILVVIATARYWIGAERYIEEIRPDYEITTDGTLIHQCGKQIYSCTIDLKDANQIVQDLLEQNPKTEITVAADRQVFWNSLHISESERLHKAVYNDYSKPLSCQINKIAAGLPDSETAAEIARKNHCRLQGYRGENMYAFMAENSGKTQAIRELAKLLNISLNDIVSFGDDINDMEMLRICGTGVAVSNALKDVKEAADYVTLSNDEDGVADWIEKNVLHNKMFQEIEWLFFDVGSTIMNEQAAYEHRMREIAKRADISYEKVYEMALTYYNQNKKGDLEAAKALGVELPKWHKEDEVLYDDAVRCLKALSKKYKIGVIANQSLGTKERLEQKGILKYIDLVIASAEEGAAKPDRRIFEIALERSRCEAAHAIMIGDRIDNDIVPANLLGMNTIWIRQGFGQYWHITQEIEKPDFVVNSLAELGDIL